MSKNFMKGIHKDAKNNWLMAVVDAMSNILAVQSMPERRKILDDLAQGIHGVGVNTIDDTLAYIELHLNQFRTCLVLHQQDDV